MILCMNVQVAFSVINQAVNSVIKMLVLVCKNR